MKPTNHLLALLCGSFACSLQFGDETTTTTSTTTSDGQSETGIATTDTGAAPTTGTSEPPGSTGEPPNPTTPPTTTTPPDDTTVGASTGFEFIITPDGGNEPVCDPFAQDCPDGMKCNWWASGGGSNLNDTKCVPLDRDPVGAGATCVAEGGGSTGIDNCELGALCWNVDENGEGECVGLCIGSPREPKCSSDVTSCIITGDGFGLCLSTCDPLAQLCDADELCLPGGESYICAPDGGDPARQLHESCDAPQECAPGLLCVEPKFAGECNQMAVGCCEPFCDLDQVNTCEGVDQQCLPLLEPPPAGFENVGVCMLPP